MKIEVRYYTKSGNTKKVALAIASAVGVKAETIDKPVTDADVLFIGSSVYAAGVDESVKRFIASLDRNKVQRIVNFSTAALLPSTYKQVKQLVEQQRIKMDEKEYHCRGSFGMLHKSKPDQKDLQEAAAFARRVIHS